MPYMGKDKIYYNGKTADFLTVRFTIAFNRLL
jgi:hypothetical protein